MSGTIIFLVIVAAVLLYGVILYNRLVGLRNQVRNSFAQIDVQLTRRHDLIPNLVEAVKGYMKHERETLEAVVNARKQASQASQKAAADPADAISMKSLLGAESALTGTLGKLFALVENTGAVVRLFGL